MGILLLRKIGDGFKKANLGSLLSDLFVCPWWFLQLHTLLWLRISSQFQGSSKRCMITFVAKLLAAFYAFVAAVCTGSSSPSVASDSHGVISPISTRGSLLSCLLQVKPVCIATTAGGLELSTLNFAPQTQTQPQPQLVVRFKNEGHYRSRRCRK
ncbi:hypothetical protein Bca52824_091059 [Brassica carinata]|uniref:Uncharacterized protein n=1 Tax=Brassica carinata TaxID=52824 RepID=A0A8X7NWW8_BRACI|nr:hypothetical protein Bca52824_091059 [Brassica carinata]